MVKKIESNTILESQPRVPGGFFVDYDIIQKGILDGKKAYKGPNFVQIDLTNNCNNNCVGCWCHSFLLGDLMLKGEEKKKFIPFDLIKKTIDNLASLGTYEVLLAGSGEPFMHPDIMKILEYIKKKNIKINLITNFSLLDKKKVKKIVKLGIDFITISLWAGTLETYLKTHPNSTRKTFENIKKNLIYLNSLKKNSKPQVKIYNVISNLNYLEIEKMVDFAVETSSDFVEFTLIDIIPNKTDCLLLSDSQKKEVIRQFPNLKLKYNYFSKLKYPLFKSSKLNFISMFKLLKEVTRNSVSMFGKDKDIDSELESFGVFVRDPVLPKGFSYDGKNVKCPRGRLNDVTYLEEGGDSCVVFEFYSLKNKE
ncbi:MAG: radical SAM protein, partial [Nanoarchaeota archaeon]|nr:radical SAM protein [Nanoarchaeota archaeon]